MENIILTKDAYNELLKIKSEHLIFKIENISLKTENELLKISLKNYKLNESINEGVLSDELIELYNTDLRDTSLSTRVLNSLHSASFYKIGDLIQYDASNLIKLRNMGQKGVKEIMLMLKAYNLYLQP